MPGTRRARAAGTAGNGAASAGCRVSLLKGPWPNVPSARCIAWPLRTGERQLACRFAAPPFRARRAASMAKPQTPQPIRGTQDIFGADAEAFAFVVDTFERVRKLYRFRRVEMPVFERTEVFSRAIG